MSSPRPSETGTEFTTVGTKFANLNGSRGNAYAHQALMDDWKTRATHAIRDHDCEPVPEPVVITATVHRTTRAKSDAHNVVGTIKACIDAAVSQALISDDNDDVVHEVRIRRGDIVRVDGKAMPAISIRIEEAP